MAKYLKHFGTHTEYETYINSQAKVLPNVSYCDDQNDLHYNKKETPTPIPPVGRVQVFANPECTQYANGHCADLWVRLNQDFGFNDTTTWGTPQESETCCEVFTPTDKYPQDEYSLSVWIDWTSQGTFSEPFTSGQVVKCVFAYEDQPILDNAQTIFM